MPKVLMIRDGLAYVLKDDGTVEREPYQDVLQASAPDSDEAPATSTPQQRQRQGRKRQKKGG